MTAAFPRALAVLALVLCLAACAGEDPVQGAYVSNGPQGQASLELKDNGKGRWSTPDEDIPLTWERRGLEIWLHAKAGGVVVARIQPDGALLARMPGLEEMSFRRSR